MSREYILREMAISHARQRLACNLRWLRFQRGWSQEALADAAGLHRTHISQIERGVCNVRLDSIEKLAAAFDAEIGQLFMNEEARWFWGRKP